jgi:cysteine synthase B
MSAVAALPAASVLDAIGGTPLLRVHLSGLPAGVEVWAKCEWFNPGGSVKDRTARSLVLEGERSGRLRPGLTIIDSSSGNTAVGLALVGRARGYAVELVMPDHVSADRRRLCEAYGAALTLTPAFDGSDGALVEVRRRVAAEPDRYFYADQYRSPANPLAHYRSTGPEVWGQTNGRVTHFVAGLGTTGTIVGTGRYLHERDRRVRVIAVEPDEPLHGLEGLKHLPSAIVPEVYDPRVEDAKIRVATDDGYRLCREVLDSDGLLVGHSAGAVLWAARAVARSLSAPALVVALLADGGERYL